jgi:hypothetical protein
MSNNQCIIPECYIDSCLTEVLLHAGKNHVNHQKGNGTVAREMKEKFGDGFCVGIIDEDRKDLDYLKEFTLLKETRDLKLRKHKDKHHYIIQLRPVIEEWIINNCNRSGIDLSLFSLPVTINQLKKVSKSTTSKSDTRFVQLFKEMEKCKVEAVMELKKWLDYLKNNNYHADIKELRNG